MTRASAANAAALPEQSLASAIAASEAAIGAHIEFDADRYVLEMRLLGVELTVEDPYAVDGHMILSRNLDGVDREAYEALEAKWAGLSYAGRDADADHRAFLVCKWLEEERGHAEAYRLVGHDVAKGLGELRRIKEQNLSLDEAENTAKDQDPRCRLESTRAAIRAANEGGFRYYWMLRHLWGVPITSFEDVGLKAVFASEHGDYIDDDDPAENIRYGVINQIADFFEKLQARKWIAGARKAGLSVFPWHCSITDTNSRGVMTFGQDREGPNEFSAASDRFRRSRASRAVDGLRKGIVFDALCEDFEVDPADPAMCDKVNIKLRAMDQARKTQDHQGAGGVSP